MAESVRCGDRCLIVLGSGTGVPVRDRRPAGYLLQYAGRGLLFDLGPGAWHSAHRYIRPQAIDYVLLSHPHLDHCLDALTFLYSVSLAQGRGPHPTLMASRETLRQVERWVQATPNLSLDMVPTRTLVAGEQLTLWEGVRLTTGAVAHVPGSLAYRVDFPDGASLTYSGDTTWCLCLVQLAYRTTLLLLECAHARPSAPHLWPEAAAVLARRAEAGKTILTHFYPDALTRTFRQQCRQFFTTPFVWARDGGVYPIEGPSSRPAVEASAMPCRTPMPAPDGPSAPVTGTDPGDSRRGAPCE